MNTLDPTLSLNAGRTNTLLISVCSVLCAVGSQLLLRRAIMFLPRPDGFFGMARFLSDTLRSPWFYGSLTLQLFAFVLLVLLLCQQTLGAANAGIGAGFYIAMALSGWLVYGEALTPLQWLGVLTVSAGVACIALGGIKA